MTARLRKTLHPMTRSKIREMAAPENVAAPEARHSASKKAASKTCVNEVKAQFGYNYVKDGNEHAERAASFGLTARCIFLRDVADLQQITCDSCCVLTGHG
jgi:hypothetical protein